MAADGQPQRPREGYHLPRPEPRERLNVSGSLSERGRELVQFLREFQLEHGWMPSVRELQEGLGISTSTVVYHLDRLEQDGYLTRVHGQPRCLCLTERGSQAACPTPLVGEASE